MIYLTFYILLACCISNINDFKRRLFYDSLINIDSFIFMIGANQMSEDDAKEVIQDVIIPMRIQISKILENKNEEMKNNKNDEKEEKTKDEKKELENESKEIKHIKQYVNKMTSNESTKVKKGNKDIKKELRKILQLVASFSPIVNTEYDEIKKSLEKRNKLFESDNSQIAKGLFNDSHKKLLQDFDELFDSQNNNPSKNEIIDALLIMKPDKNDMLFFEMIETIERAITESDVITKIKDREIREFSINFGPKKNQEDLSTMRISFNLGLVFLSPGIYISISKMLLIPEKSVFLEKMTNKMLKPILTLTADNSNGTDTEKKENILIFMNDVVSRKFSKYTEEIDEAYKSRSTILDKFFEDQPENKKDEKIEKIDYVLEKRNEKLLKDIQNMHAENFKNFLILNQELVNSYIRFISSNNEDDKKKVYDFF